MAAVDSRIDQTYADVCSRHHELSVSWYLLCALGYGETFNDLGYERMHYLTFISASTLLTLDRTLILRTASFKRGRVTVGPGRNDRRPGDKELSTKSLAYRRDESYG